MIDLYYSFILFLLISLLTIDNVKGFEIVFTLDPATGLIYLLLILFFSLNIGTPFAFWLYHYYISKLAEKAGKELAKVSKRMSDRISDAGRKVSQSIRSA
mmetsp:Transcript_19715/g.21429  ORF Transcript_19715/g.21429 Transcript_19715/m.21429 type:complete len:100 (+) Transcript_19715:3-302(+)